MTAPFNYLIGARAAFEKFALSPQFINRALTNTAARTGARIAPGLLEKIQGNRPALLSLAKNVRAPGALAPTMGQQQVSGVLDKFRFFEHSPEYHNPIGPRQLPWLNRELGMKGKVVPSGVTGRDTVNALVDETFGPRPGWTHFIGGPAKPLSPAQNALPRAGGADSTAVITPRPRKTSA